MAVLCEPPVVSGTYSVRSAQRVSLVYSLISYSQARSSRNVRESSGTVRMQIPFTSPSVWAEAVQESGAATVLKALQARSISSSANILG